MSRIGKLPIKLSKGVEIAVSADNVVTVKGALGELKQAIDPCIKLELDKENALLTLTRATDQKHDRAMHGLYRALLANMVKGVSEGFKTTQEVIGVGYKAQANDQVLELALGFSHNVFFELPKEVKVETINEKGKNPVIVMQSIDKQLLGQVAAKIRSLRKPEPYKGKGIRFAGEVVRKKAGKSASSK